MAALDASIARGDLETISQDLPQLLRRPATPLTEVIRAACNAALTAPPDNRQNPDAARSATAIAAVD